MRAVSRLKATIRQAGQKALHTDQGRSDASVSATLSRQANSALPDAASGRSSLGTLNTRLCSFAGAADAAPSSSAYRRPDCAALPSRSPGPTPVVQAAVGNFCRGFAVSTASYEAHGEASGADIYELEGSSQLRGEPEGQSPETDDDAIRRVDMPLIHPKAIVTSEFHPCGAELLEFPFGAKAFYIGKDYNKRIQLLRDRASDDRLQMTAGISSNAICLRQSDRPFDDEEDYTGLPCETYIFPLDRMESVVFFNGFGRERDIWEEHTGGQLTSRFVEETRVSVIPDLDKRSKLFSDRVVLQQAELNNLQTIAFVLGQTVSLHYYELQVDHMLRTFKDMNKEMRRTGTFKPVATKEELLQMVAQNNLLFTDIISKLGIMERFDIAWKNTHCNDVYEHLRTDMEIENRNANLQVKLHLVSENVKYLLELMQNQKSDFLEWIIIILIGAEIMVSLFDMMHKLN